ncbi:MAG TPA: alpha/beta hydrolase-fold protein [Bryobacteraceae bacterium]|nr:alpha/beta hydrolase-fold protein [Bryobacteraceae bacterium]
MRTVFFLFAGTLVSLAQQPQPAPIQSPEVQQDGRVIFRLRDPNAQHVEVNLAGTAQPYVMQKDQQGVWSITTPALAPDLYGYSFNADGVHLLDPSNHALIPNLLNPSSEVHVPGPSPLPWEATDIPHGIIHHQFYRSGIIGDNRDFFVYTPPGYDPNASTRYPVLYLLHGYSDDASAWTAVGRANLILDSLIADAKAKPMVIVMPLGYGAPEIVERSPAGAPPLRNASLREKNITNFTAALIDEVIPQVERTYKVESNRDARAVAGLSMGGAESLLTGLNHLDKFSWVGSFSAGGVGDNFAAAFPRLDAGANAQLHLLWIACGTDDRLITANRSLITWLKGKDMKLTQIETPGMHAWMVWRRNLVNFAPLLFQSGVPGAAPASVSGDSPRH